MQQRAAVEDGLGNARGQIPKARSRREDLAEGQRHAAGVGGQVQIRKPVRDGDPNLRAGGMEVLHGLLHVRPLGHQLRGKAHRQLLRQLEAGKVKLLGKLLARESAGEFRQQVALLRQLLHQRRQGGLDLRELRFLRRDVQAGHVALRELVAQDLQHVAVLRSMSCRVAAIWPRKDAS